MSTYYSEQSEAASVLKKGNILPPSNPMMRTLSLLPLIIALAVGQVMAQIFRSINYPHSIVSGGMGEQGVMLANPTDAMQYNPANLARTDDLSFSFFRMPWPQYGANGFPVTAAAMSYKLPTGMSFGIEYTDWDLRTIPVTTEDFPDGTGETHHVYERSFAGAMALPLGSDWALGAELRYGVNTFQSAGNVQHLLLGVGASYRPETFNDRLHAGFSLMNFSTPAHFSIPTIEPVTEHGGTYYLTRAEDSAVPVDARINLGADFAIVHEPLYDLTLSLGFTKAIVKNDSLNNGQSSFKALFTDWTDFPRDVTTHFGLGWVWKPLPLGGGVSYIQEMYLGFTTAGVAAENASFFTHGVRAGFDFAGIKATAGYAGRWHNNNAIINFYSDDIFVTEVFQFGVSADLNALRGYDTRTDRGKRLQKIIVSAGYSYCTHPGRWEGLETWNATTDFEMPTLWSVESDFYLTENSALIGSFAYGRLVESTVDDRFGFTRHLSEDVETLSLESGYRYHPADAFRPFFVQVSLGIIRFNPVNDYTAQRHLYYTYDNLVVGCALPIGHTGITVVPKAGFKTIFMDGVPNIDQLNGNNQFEFGVNIGYTL